MRGTYPARYARWSAVVALVLVAITVGVYLERSWIAYRQKQKAPPPPPPSVERQTGGITFSKVERDRTIFTVRASRSTEFKGKDENLLEDVQITIFGQSGDRQDRIHTTSCQSAKESGRIICSGDVRMELESAADAERSQKDKVSERVVHVETRGVSFDRGTGIAETDQPVRFVFPSGRGEAVGAEYRSDAGILLLKRDVRLAIRQSTTKSSTAGGTANGGAQEAHVRGAALEYQRKASSLRLRGPVDADFGTVHLTAGELTLLLDAGNRAQRLVASAAAGGNRPEIRSQGTRGESKVSADSVTAHFSPAGWVEKVEAAGSVRGSLHGQAEEDQLEADKIEVQLLPRVEKPRDLTLDGNVSLRANPLSGESRALQTAAMHVLFKGGNKGESNRPERAETLAAGTIRWTERPDPTRQAGPQTELSADRLALDFGAGGRAERLEANGNVQTRRQIPGRAMQTATSRNATAQLAASGGWMQMDLQGDVRLKEGDRSAQAEQATFRRGEQTAVLTGGARVRDTATETQAQRITFLQNTGDIRAEGAVRSSDLSPRTSTVHLAPQAVNVTAETLLANSQTGRALYTGRARLWQGDSVVEADSIELLRNPRGLNANGNVRAIFPQTAFSAKPVAANPIAASSNQPTNSFSLWHVRSESLAYRDAESRAHLEKNVFAVSDTESIRAAALDLFFSRGRENGAQQLNRAVGTGGVTIEQGDRRGVAERGEYIASAGKFVLSGGTPTLYDASRGTTTGRQLTFFLADDTIIVDSENGSRTLTKHRVEK